MNKIIAAFDGLRFSESTMQYAIYLAKEYNAHVTGVFLRESTRLGYAIYATIVKQSLSGKEILDEIDRSEKITIDQAIETFESGCRDANLSYAVHHNKRNAVQELLHETAFADLMVIDAWETFSYLEEDMPGWFIKNILHDAQCPVLVVPRNFSPLERSALLYDGSPSSIYAIKMFSYILPGMRQLETKVLYAKNDSGSLHLPDDELLKDWMERHYPKAAYQLLSGSEKEIPAMLAKEDPGTLVVAGSYHRSNVSMWFHKSMADLLLKETRAPVFIAHR